MEPNRERRSQEIRVGLVMYGGVSLAIYINGVAEEFFRAVRGRGVYKLLKAMADSEIVVDVISGTSAGGINGILLSHALCNNLEFSSCATLWREYGDIRRMLRSPEADGASTNSLLDSEGYYQENLEKAFIEMRPCAEEPAASSFDELDLFVTSTDVDGRLYTVLDDRGYPVDVKDHRAVFTIKHRKGRKEQFRVRAEDGSLLPTAGTTVGALAKLGRATSCFPAAFEPVLVTDAQADDSTVDGKLQKWGNLGKESCFLDGGVLDNKPFTYTLREIFYRMADRRVDRKLFYVEPDPEEFHRRREASRPNILQAVLAALIGIPGYESISEDLKLIVERNSKISQYNRIAAAIGGGAADQHAPATLRFIERSRAESGGADSGADPLDLSGYEMIRLIALSERAVQGVLRAEGRNELLRGPEERQAAGRLYAMFDDPERPETWPRRGSLILRDYDVYFRIRRAFSVNYRYYDLELAQPSEPAVSREVFARLNAFIDALNIVRHAIEKTLDDVDFRWRDSPSADVWRRVDAALARLLDVKGPGGEPLLQPLAQAYGRPGAGVAAFAKDEAQAGFAALYQTLTGRCSELKPAARTRSFAAAPEFRSLLLETDKLELAVIGELAARYPENRNIAELRRRHDEFVYTDALLFPLQYAADLFETDLIDTIRISPKDAQRGLSAKKLEDKVAGDAFYHFGGFFKRSWRSNDILWGRLDGACKIVETFFTPARIAEVARDRNLAQQIEQRLSGDLDPKTLFPNSSPEDHAKIRGWLLGLLRGDADARAAFDSHLDCLIEAAQLEILHENLPKVMEDAVLEQAEWNQYRIGKLRASGDPGADGVELDPATLAFKPARNELDPLVAVSATGHFVEQAMQSANRYPGGLKGFFREAYRVGAEDLFKDVPLLVLLEIMASALLVARNALLSALKPGWRDRVQSSAVYGWINGALVLFHALVAFLRRSPAWRQTIAVAVFAVSIVALWVGINWYGEIIHPPKGFSLTWLVAFIIAPVVALSVLACGVLRCRVSTWIKLLAWAGLVVAIVVAAETLGVGRGSVPLIAL